MQQKLSGLLTRIQEALKDGLQASSITFDALTLTVSSEALVRVLLELRDAPGLLFNQLIDICGADYLGREYRFEVIYHLLSLPTNQRVRVKAQVRESEAAPSVASLFSCANWYEREVWDMYGIPFAEHPDLRRLLTDYGFEGFPLRKDFPLTGYQEVRYDSQQGKVVYEPVNLPQEFRNFDFLSPWEGMTINRLPLPGDEKAESQAGV